MFSKSFFVPNTLKLLELILFYHPCKSWFVFDMRTKPTNLFLLLCAASVCSFFFFILSNNTLFLDLTPYFSAIYCRQHKEWHRLDLSLPGLFLLHYRHNIPLLHRQFHRQKRRLFSRHFAKLLYFLIYADHNIGFAYLRNNTFYAWLIIDNIIDVPCAAG